MSFRIKRERLYNPALSQTKKQDFTPRELGNLYDSKGREETILNTNLSLVSAPEKILTEMEASPEL